MKTLILAIVLTLTLTACAQAPVKVQPEPPVIVQTKYIIKLPPAQDMTLPKPVTPINPDTATQLEVANWLILKDTYTKQLENQLKNIATFFETSAAENAAKTH